MPKLTSSSQVFDHVMSVVYILVGTSITIIDFPSGFSHPCHVIEHYRRLGYKHSINCEAKNLTMSGTYGLINVNKKKHFFYGVLLSTRTSKLTENGLVFLSIQ
ncbi:unnamed protein product [Ilex paraguariensis]|uniref:Uncharacterized protein n=1 Tax=Ilex paraguariensis TaxID=185542 RepID=A0ABC8S6R4_9AQUA